MNVIEAILTGIQFKGLQKPIIFFCMLFGVVLFGLFAIGLLFISVQEIISGSKIELSLVLGSLIFSGICWGLVFACGFFMKRCFE